MDDEAFAAFRETRSPSSSASDAEVEENEPSARRRRDGDDEDEDDEDDDLDEGTSRGRARSGPIEPSLGVGRFETTAEHIGWYLSLDDGNLGEDYASFCLAECERARAEGRREDEFFYYAELVADDVYWAVKNARSEGARPSRCAGLAEAVGRRLTRVMALAAELDSTERSAKAHCLAAMYYCYFHDFSSEEVLEHAGMCLQFARALREEAPDTSETRALGYEIHALRAMRSVSDRSTRYAMKSVSGSISDAISLGTKVVMLARREYYHRNITEGLAAESVVIFIEHLIEHALVLRGWREHNGKVVSTPPLERFAADVLKEAKQELENFWTKTSTSWRDDDVLRGQYMFILCHLADLCDNHLDSSHIVVDETKIQSFTAKSERLHRALAVGYRALLSAIDSEIFNPPCVLCRRPLRSTSDSPDDPGFCDDDEPLEFVALSCAGFHHYHRRCRERFAAYAVADSPLPDVVVDRGLERVSPCRFCARDRAASVEATTSRPFVRFPIPQPSRARAPRSPGRSDAFQAGHTPSL